MSVVDNFAKNCCYIRACPFFSGKYIYFFSTHYFCTIWRQLRSSFRFWMILRTFSFPVWHTTNTKETRRLLTRLSQRILLAICRSWVNGILITYFCSSPTSRKLNIFPTRSLRIVVALKSRLLVLLAHVFRSELILESTYESIQCRMASRAAYKNYIIRISITYNNYYI